MKFWQLIFNISTLKIVVVLGVLLLGYSMSLEAADYKGDEQMFSKLFAFHSKLASQGNLESITQLGLMYERGEGVKKDRKKAIELYQIAADKGYQPAIEYLVNINAKKSNSSAPVNTADRLRVPTPKETASNSSNPANNQQELEDKLEKQQQEAKAARAELEKLRQTKLEQERKQKQLQDEIEQARKTQEKIARERDKAEAARRELELAKKKQLPAAQKQQDAALNQPNKVQPENTSSKAKDGKDSNFSSNPCNTPAAKFMSTCN